MSGPFGSSQFMYKTGEEEGQSLRFENSDSAYLNWTPPSVGSSLTQTLSFWMKRTTAGNYIFRASEFYLYLVNDNLNYYDWRQGANGHILVTNAVYRDVSAWMHVVLTQDRGNATASDRIKLYVNGEQVTSFSTATYPNQNEGSYFNNSGNIHYMGGTSGNFFDGYLANVTFIDGQALDPTSFGEYDGTLWKPKSDTDIQALTFGTNGFYLNFEDSSAIGDDTSGNANDWTANNLVATDVVLDSPVNGGNFATYNSALPSTMTLSEGNLKASQAGAAWLTTAATFYVSSGKWYWETRNTDNDYHMVGIVADSFGTYTNHVGITADSYSYYNWAASGSAGNKYNNGVATSYGDQWAAGDIIGVALDLDAGTIEFYKNNVSQGVAFTGISGTYAPAESLWTSGSIANFGQDSSFAGNETPQGNGADGEDFFYSPPSGFLALTTGNLPTPTITAPDEYFNTILWTGNATYPRSITGVNFQPDLIWIKARNQAYNHVLQDSVRGTGAAGLYSTAAQAEGYYDDYHNITSFDTDGFTVDQTTLTDVFNGVVSSVGITNVAWNWKADTAFSNSAGTNGADLASTGRVNQDAGFSIVSFDLEAAGSKTVAHGLSSAPEMIIVKSRDAATLWPVYTEPTGNTKYLVLGTADDEAANSTVWDNTSPTSSVFTIGSGFTTGNYGTRQIAYCFHSVEGYSKIGSYTGSSDLPFVHCGFRPAWILIKRTDITSAESWTIKDTTRSPYNESTIELYANLTATEYDDIYGNADFLSNGFKLRSNNLHTNTTGGTYIFMAFAEAPFNKANAR
jgi:hypothetical protein